MIHASSGMVNSLYALKLSWYVTNCLVELSLAIPLWVDTVSSSLVLQYVTSYVDE